MRGDAPLLVDRSAVVAAPRERVWEFITDFEQLPRWLPGLARCEVDDREAEVPGQVGAVRVIVPILGGPTTYERVTAFEPPERLVYSATDASLLGMATDHRSVLTLQPRAGETEVRWAIYARLAQGLRGAAGRQVFRFVASRGLSNLTRLLGKCD